MKCIIALIKSLFFLFLRLNICGINMARKKKFSIREERFFLAAKAIKESIRRNSSANNGGYNCPIIVEGINDIKCLRSLGFTGIIETVNKGWDRPRIIAYLNETYGSELAIDGLPRIILLMDWDRTGDILQKTFTNLLNSMDIKVDQSLRNALSKQFKSECRTVESMISYSEQLTDIISLM